MFYGLRLVAQDPDGSRTGDLSAYASDSNTARSVIIRVGMASTILPRIRSGVRAHS